RRGRDQWRELDALMPDALGGRAGPAGPPERLRLAALARQPYRACYATAAALYADAFAARPTLAPPNRYNAARAAALAGTGQGKDADKLDDKERARLRQQALDWLRADLTAWRKQLKDNEAMARAVVRQAMQHWLTDTDFAGVRDRAALAKLPESDRQDWQKLWADVKDLFSRTAAELTEAVFPRPDK